MNLKILARKQGETVGRADARSYDKDPECFDPSENPYGIETESDQYEAWEIAYENSFEGSKTKP